MEFRQLQSLEAVVRLGSFTKAAEELFTSQPTVSTHVRLLEEELHARLVLRTTKTIEVTPKGREVYDYAVGILSLRERMRQCCVANARRVIHVGASTIPSAYILPEALPEYGRLNPETYFALHQCDSPGVEEGLLSGVYDVGLTGARIVRDELLCESFCEDHTVLIAPVEPRFLQMQSRAVTPIRELLREPMILREEGAAKIADRYLESIGVRADDLRVVARVNDQETVKSLVANGLGVSILSARAALDFVREKRLLSFELPDFDSRRSLYIARPRVGTAREDVERFAAFILRRYREGQTA